MTIQAGYVATHGVLVASDKRVAGRSAEGVLSTVWPREPFDTLQRKRDAGPFSHMARN